MLPVSPEKFAASLRTQGKGVLISNVFCVVLSLAVVGAVFADAAITESELMTLDQLHLQAPEPPQPPDSDQSEFPGQPLQCDNYKQTAPAHRCHCARDRQKCEGMPQGPVDVAMDRDCKTFCKKQHCECRGTGCRS